MQKFNKIGIVQRSLVFNHSTKDYPQVKHLLEKNKKLRKKIVNTAIPVNNSLLKYVNKGGLIRPIPVEVGKTHTINHDLVEKLGYKGQSSKSSINLESLEGIDFGIVNSNVMRFNNNDRKASYSPMMNPINMIVDMKPIELGSKFNTANIVNIEGNNNIVKPPRRESFITPTTHYMIPNFEPKDSSFKTKRSNSIIVVPEKAIDNVLSNLKDFEFNNGNSSKDQETKKFDSGNNNYSFIGNTNNKNNKTPNDNIFAVDNSFFNNKITDTTFNFINLTTTTSPKKPNIRSLDDMLLNPTFFEEIPIVSTNKQSQLRHTIAYDTTKDNKNKDNNNFNDISTISSIAYVNEMNRSMDVSNILLNNTQILEEDRFDPTSIRKQVRMAILV
jgi:hypothetical protein